MKNNKKKKYLKTRKKEILNSKSNQKLKNNKS